MNINYLNLRFLEKSMEKENELIIDIEDKIIQQDTDIISLSAKAVQSNQNMKEAISAVDHLTDRMSTFESQVQHVSSTVETTVANINRLATKLLDIHKILDVITDLTSNIKVLSINAAIEAARVGDVGKGFAVVSTEIRKLTASADGQTKNISTFVKDIEQSLNTQKKDIALLKESFEGINLALSEMSRSSETMMNINKEQETFNKDISSWVETIRKTSNEIKSALHQRVAIIERGRYIA